MAIRLFGAHRGMPASPWGPGGALLALVAVTALSVLLAGLFMAAIAAAVPHVPLTLPTRCPADASGDCVAAGLVFLNLLYLLLAAGLLVACWLRPGASVADSLLLRSPGWRPWQYAAFAVATLLTLIILQQLLLHLTVLSGGSPRDLLDDLNKLRQAFGAMTVSTATLLIVLAVVLAPLAEEFVFRGFLYGAFRKTRLGVVGAAVVLSAAWAALHWGYSSQNIIALFGLGLLFAYIVWRTGSVLPAIFGHAVNNLVAVMILIFYDPQVASA